MTGRRKTVTLVPGETLNSLSFDFVEGSVELQNDDRWPHRHEEKAGLREAVPDDRNHGNHPIAACATVDTSGNRSW